jgi:hypothetical protein
MIGSPVQDAGVRRAEDLARGSKLGRKERDRIQGNNRKAAGGKDGRPKHEREIVKECSTKGRNDLTLVDVACVVSGPTSGTCNEVLGREELRSR